MKNRIIKLLIILFAATLVFASVSQTAFAESSNTKHKTEYFKIQSDAYRDKNIVTGIVVSYVNCQTFYGEIYRGYSIVSIDGDVIDLSLDMLNWLALNFKNVLIEDNAIFVCNYYPSMTDLYIANGYSGYDKPEPSDMKEEKIGLKLKYTSALDPSSFFSNDLAKELILEVSQSYNVPVYKSYIYASKFNQKRLSSSADYIYGAEASRLFIHEFNADKTDGEIYQTIPNSKLINYGAIAVGLLFVVGFVAAFFIMEKKK